MSIQIERDSVDTSAVDTDARYKLEYFGASANHFSAHCGSLFSTNGMGRRGQVHDIDEGD